MYFRCRELGHRCLLLGTSNEGLWRESQFVWWQKLTATGITATTFQQTTCLENDLKFILTAMGTWEEHMDSLNCKLILCGYRLSCTG